MEKRARKMQTFIQNEFNENFYGYEVINPEAKKFFITMGVNRYALEQWIKNKEALVLNCLDFLLKERI